MKPDEPIPREEFEAFTSKFVHDLRNFLNAISLEAADLAEQSGVAGGGARLQEQVRRCSNYLKEVRLAAAPQDPAERIDPAEALRRAKAHVE
jgi:signal transduction histidine kinase